VNSTNTLPHFGNDGQIHTSVAGVSQYMHEQFNSGSLLTDQPYFPGIGPDYQNSGFNTLEWGITPLSGTEPQSSFISQQHS
jgi:hypothetical protein